MLISFVIPAFNASQTVTRCLDSVYALPLDENELEVLVIDDCSTDATVEVLEEYRKSHPNLTLYRQSENRRQGAARNIGVAKAIGEFVVFLDSDDEVAEGLLQAVKMAANQQLDMVAMRSMEITSDGKADRETSLPYPAEALFSGVELQTDHPFWTTAPWAYVYRRSFLKEVNYPFAEDVLYEDSDFVNVHLYHAQKMAYCDACGYCAHQNAGSTTHTVSNKHLADYALLGTRMLAFYESLPDKTSKYAESILEGGSYNIMKSFRMLYRLKSLKEIRAFYARFDAHYDRRRLRGYRKPAYCWTWWTRLCLNAPLGKNKKQ